MGASSFWFPVMKDITRKPRTTVMIMTTAAKSAPLELVSGHFEQVNDVLP